MKKILITLLMLFCGTVFAQTETLNWYMDGNIYTTTQCESGTDILLPTTPTKRGYTFKGWASYTPIEYLKSTGTQWIDTGIRLSSNIKFYTTVAPSVSNICSFKSGDHCLVIWQDSRIITFRPGIPEVSSGVPYSVGTFYNIGFNIDKRLFIVNNREILFSQTIPNLNSVIITGTTDKIKLLQIWDNDVLVRDFIPVLDPYGVPCMYDKVEKKFYYNAGTGQFIAGPVLNE